MCFNLFLGQALWEKADKLSQESGNPYKDRFGKYQNMDKHVLGLTKTVLIKWYQKHNIPFDYENLI